MIRCLQYFLLIMAVVVVACESRPHNDLQENNEDLNIIEIPALDVLRNIYYDTPTQGLYARPSMDRLQMLVAQYKPSANQPTSNWNMANEIVRVPEMKRQARYRQCYFNPISCFKK